MPQRYEDLIVGFANQLRLRRDVTVGQTLLTGKTKLRQTSDGDRGLERLVADRVGKDIADVVVLAISAAVTTLVHVGLVLNQPEIHHAVEALRQAGFVFAAWLPGWGESDVLCLQYLKECTDDELHPNLYSADAHNPLALIRTGLTHAAI
jgi:hypothetical protein